MTITIRVDKELMQTQVTVDEYLGILEGDVKVMVKLLSRFVVGEDGKYLPLDQGRKVVGTLTLVELQDTVKAFTDGVENNTVPPSSGAV